MDGRAPSDDEALARAPSEDGHAAADRSPSEHDHAATARAPSEHDHHAAGAVEVVVARAPATFVHGAFAGIALASIAAHVWLAMMLAPLRDAYRDMGSTGIPFVLAGWWRWGVPLAGVAGVAALVARRPRSVVPYAALALALVAAAIATWRIAYAPLDSLAGNIAE
ncbi:MAG TPA: hypothetical protein VLT45_25650 [Kofleriaceae bacterium]|nr:hypothetical protein [Kofleriaceae bacterium]